MSRNTRLLLSIATLVIGVAGALMPVVVKKQLDGLDALITDADDALRDHRATVLTRPGQGDDYETAVEVHKMSYLARREELVIRLWTFRIGGPLLALLGLVTLIQTLVGKRPPRQPRRRRRRIRRPRPRE